MRDVLVFDYGASPRRADEESLAGDMSKAVALAAVIRNALSMNLSEAEPDEEYGAVLFLDGPPVRKIVIEPVTRMPLTWAVRFDTLGGCLGGVLPRRVDARLESVKDALDQIVSRRSDEFRNARWISRRELRLLR